MRRIFLSRILPAFFIIIAIAAVGMFVHIGSTFAQTSSLVTSESLGLTTSTQQNIGLANTDIRVIIARIVRVALGLLGIIAVGLILYAGVTWMTAGGNEEKVGEAKKILINSVIGLAIILSAYSIASYVINKLVSATTGVPESCYNGQKDGNETGVDCGGSCRVCNSIEAGAFPNSLYPVSLPAVGDVCVANYHPIITFNRPVDITSFVTSAIYIEKISDGSKVNGSWQYVGLANKTSVEFVPNGPCGGGGGNDCFAPNTDFRFVIPFDVVTKRGTLMSLSADPANSYPVRCDLTVGCGPRSFKSGSAVDRVPPAFNITYPISSSLLEAGTTIPVTIDFSDDIGVQTIGLYKGGGLKAGPQFTIPTGAAVAVAGGDFNGDKKTDLVVGIYGTTAYLFFGDGNGNFTPAPQSVNMSSGFGKNLKTADLNNDGILDLVQISAISKNFSVAMGNGANQKGDGTFKKGVLTTILNTPIDFTLADVTSDGKIDVVMTANITNASATLYVFPGVGDGTFGVPTLYPLGQGSGGVAAADINADGKLDVVAADLIKGNLLAFINNGDGTLRASVVAVPSIGAGAQKVTAGDINKDSIPDLVWGYTSPGSKIGYAYGKGGGLFTTSTLVSGGGKDSNAIVIADINNDGYNDVVAPSMYASNFSILFSSANGLQLPVSYDLPYYGEGVFVGKFNADSYPDIAVASYYKAVGVPQLSIFTGIEPQLINSQTLNGCQKQGTATINWPTSQLDIGNHVLLSVGADYGGNTAYDQETVSLKPSSCFNSTKDPGEDQVGPPACGANSVCGQCAGGACTNNSQCASGYCEIIPPNTSGVCVDRARITDISPTAGSSTTYVSVSGYYFGDVPGRVYFATVQNPDEKQDAGWIEANLVQCGGGYSAWTPWQVIVSAPRGGITGPVKIVTATSSVNGVPRSFIDATDDAPGKPNGVQWGPKLPNYVYNDQILPGLCAVEPPGSAPGTSVSLRGQNLGSFSASSSVFFGQLKGSVNQLIVGIPNRIGESNWTNTFISEAFVPILSPGPVSVSVVNSNGQSNGVRFVVAPTNSSSSPRITGLSPTRGARGEYVTITGLNFGNKKGLVYFWANKGGSPDFTGDTQTFPPVCVQGGNLWQDKQILVKIPTNIDPAKTGTSFYVQVYTADAVASAFDDAYKFTLDAGSPSPGVCKIDPVAGGVPFAKGKTMKVYGEYFFTAGNVNAYFWQVNAATNTIARRVPADTKDGFATATIDKADVLTVRPPTSTQTGPVVAYRAGDQKMGNGVQFTANSCLDKKDICGAGFHCCAGGPDIGMCKLDGVDLCAGETHASAYVWRFATQDIPPVPHVVERCDAATKLGANIPTPSPSLLWVDRTLNNPTSTDFQLNACRNAVITVEFSTALNTSTINASNVVVNKCTPAGVDSNSGCIAIASSSIPLDPSSFKLWSSVGYQGGKSGGWYMQLVRTGNQNWEDNAWYQVTLSKNIVSYGTTSLALAADKPCGGNSAYCFAFHTDTTDCKLERVVVTPYRFWTNVLEDPILIRQFGATNVGSPLTYRGLGLSDQTCIMMNMAGYRWQWSSSNTEFATVSPVPNAADQQRAGAYANTVNIGITDPDDAVNIGAEASTTSISRVGHSPLTIDLSKPTVVEQWPNCLAACTNAEVGAKFNVSMSTQNLNWNSVKLYRCLDSENCLAKTLVTSSFSPTFSDVARRNLVIPHPDLQPNSFYKVVLSSSNTLYQLWSAGKLGSPAATSSPMEGEYSWRFSTKEGKCVIARAAVTPSEYVATSTHSRAVYGVQPYSSPDSCNAFGQRLDPWSASWDWVSSDKQVATTTSFSTVARNPFCTASCVKKGSDVPSTASLNPVCGNAKVEAGEDCDGPAVDNVGRGCGLDCRFTGNTDPVTCGDGITNAQLGEACDPKSVTSSVGCTSDCRHTGSVLAAAAVTPTSSICGSGFVGSGEDCDLAITASSSNPRSAQGCSASCLHQGTLVSKGWCATHQNVRASFASTSLDFDTACSMAISQCGDGITSPDEDAGCDLSNGKHAAWCSEFCLVRTSTAQYGLARQYPNTPITEGYDKSSGQYFGSSLLYSVPSVCGDKKVGFGEDESCETQNTISVHVGLIDPWTLAIGVGTKAAPQPGATSSLSADINASTYVSSTNSTIRGSGKFTIPCGYHSDNECAQVYGSGYGVGKDTCCYARPKLLSTYPKDQDQNVCPNSVITATFDRPIDEATLFGNVLIAEGNNQITSPALSFLSTTSSNNFAGFSDVQVVGRYAYVVASTANTFSVVKISSSTNPETVGVLKHGNGGANLVGPTAVAISGNYAFVVNSGSGNNASSSLEVIDITTSTAPRHVSTLTNLLSSPRDIRIVGDNAYVANYNDHSLAVLNIADPKNVKVLGLISANGNPGYKLLNPTALAVRGSYAYVLSYSSNALAVIDISSSTKPRYVGAMDSTVDNAVKLNQPRGIALSGNYAYVVSAGSNSLEVFNIADFPTTTKLVGSLQDGGGNVVMRGPQSISVAGNFAYIASAQSNSVQVVDITDGSNPKPVTFITTGAPRALNGASAVTVAGNKLVTGAAVSNALEIDDITSFNSYVGCEGENDVTSLLAFQNSVAPQGPWYKQLFVRVVEWVRQLFSTSPAAADIKAFKWCVGNAAGPATVIKDVNTSTWRISISLTKPLTFNSDYTVFLKEGVKDIYGVSIGRPSVTGTYHWQFSTGDHLCTIQGVKVNPDSWFFNRANATTSIEASAFSEGGVTIQSIPNVYAWQYLWTPVNNAYVAVSNTTSSINTMTARNNSGVINIFASAVVLPNDLNLPSGPVATSKSNVTVFLCERPWPPRDLYLNDKGPFTIFPYEDSKVNNDAYSIASDTFTNTANPRTDADVFSQGYFNFRTYYCAGNGSENLPWLRPALNVTSSSLKFSSTGKCEFSNADCFVNADCGEKHVVGKSSFALPLGTVGVCGGVTSTPPTNTVFYDTSGQPVACAIGNAGSCAGAAGFTDWVKGYKNAVCVPLTDKAKPLTCYYQAPVKRFVFTNDTNSDVIGIQVFANPRHLTPEEWFTSDKSAGGQGFVGNLQKLSGIDGYEAVSDGNNVYINGLNYTSTTPTTGTLETMIYLISVNKDAAPTTKNIFEQLITNFSLNTNFSNTGFCFSPVTGMNTSTVCVADNECGSGEVCSTQINNLKRDYQRIRDLRVFDKALETYAASHKGVYPNLAEGTYLKGQTISTWPSWSLLSNAVGASLPEDPINQLGPAGTCVSSTNKFCLSETDCPTININTSTREQCIIHTPDTGWSVANRRFSFACNPNSFAYRYIFSTSTGYTLLAEFEDIGIERPINFDAFVDGFGFTTTSRFSIVGPQQSGICVGTSTEISTLNQGICGDREINWLLGEQCDPRGSTVYDYSACNAQGGDVTVRTCSNDCKAWNVSKIVGGCVNTQLNCGNGRIDSGEVCDDGKALNGTYGHCNVDCKSSGAVCGDGVVQAPYELCEIASVQLKQNSGWCMYGLNIDKDCSKDADCLSSVVGACQLVRNTGVKYTKEKTDSCNFDCRSTGPYCGDGVVQAQFGEQCDINQKPSDFACTIDGVSGVRQCGTDCTWRDSTVAGWWRLDDMAINVNAQTIFDYSDNKNNAICAIGCPSMKYDGIFANALDFKDGTFLYAPHIDKLMPTSTLTVEAWIRPRSLANIFQMIVAKGGWNYTENLVKLGGGYDLELLNDKPRFNLWASFDGTDIFTVDSVKPVVAGVWSHVVGTYQWSQGAQRARIYINGVLTGDTGDIVRGQPSMKVNRAPVIIGGSGQDRIWNFQGTLDEVKIYSRVLNEREIVNHYESGLAKVGICKPSKPLAAGPLPGEAGTCGDGKINPPKEACDNGLVGDQRNGNPCSPKYGVSCSYCSADCSNVITVESNSYCGDGVLQANEMCDTAPNGDIFVTSTWVDPTSTDINIDQSHNGYALKQCENESQSNATLKKGTKICTNNCTKVLVKETNASSCIVCGLVDDQNGVEVGGNIINVLNPFETPFRENTVHNIDFYIGNWGIGRQRIAHSYGINGNSYTLVNNSAGAIPAPLQSSDRAFVATHPLCSIGPSQNYRLILNTDLQTLPDEPHSFDFPVFSTTSPEAYDLLLSPVIPKSVRPDDVRFVVSWVGDFQVIGGFLLRDPQSGQILSIDGPSIALTTSTDYYNRNQDVLWFHGASSTRNRLNEQAYTFDTSIIPAGLQIIFYAYTPDAINKHFNDKVKVDVYMPEADMYPLHFARPAMPSFELKLSQKSNNPSAKFWQVFNFGGPDISADVTGRIIKVYDVFDGATSTYDHGRVVTGFQFMK